MDKKDNNIGILDAIRKDIPQCVYHVNIPILSVPRNLEEYSVDLDPVYQRGYVWSESQQSLFVGALIQNPTSIPKFIFNFVGESRVTSEIVDGKQRINAICKWINGELRARTFSGIYFSISDLSPVEKTMLRTTVTIDCSFVELSKIEVMRYYLALNSGGTVHSKKELDRILLLINGGNENDCKPKSTKKVKEDENTLQAWADIIMKGRS